MPAKADAIAIRPTGYAVPVGHTMGHCIVIGEIVGGEAGVARSAMPARAETIAIRPIGHAVPAGHTMGHCTVIGEILGRKVGIG